MKLNMNFEELVIVDYSSAAWVPSPNGEVLRLKLERNGDESGYATSLVRYPENSRFPKHSHPGGEEFLVLEGTFSDESGDYGVGSYVRNAIGSTHAPFSHEGCLIFVKLWQMSGRETSSTLQKINFLESKADTKILFDGEPEKVFYKKIKRGSSLQISNSEILVLRGEIVLNKVYLKPFSWARIPQNKFLEIKILEDAFLWVKERNYSFFKDLK